MTKRTTTSRPVGPRRGSDAARQKSKAFRQREAERARRQRMIRWGAVVAAVLLVAVIVIVVVTLHGNSGPSAPPAAGPTAGGTPTLTGPPGPEGIVLEQGSRLAPESGSAQGQTVDGIHCNSMEQAVYHIHIHLSIYVNGVLRAVPAGIGVVQPVPQPTAHGDFDQASRCYYWLHTHAQDGIIHVEAPSHATYTLGNFFAIWRQPLSANQVGPARGRVTVYVNGARRAGNPASIPLTIHEELHLDVGSPTVSPRNIDWSHAQL